MDKSFKSLSLKHRWPQQQESFKFFFSCEKLVELRESVCVNASTTRACKAFAS